MTNKTNSGSSSRSRSKSRSKSRSGRISRSISRLRSRLNKSNISVNQSLIYALFLAPVALIIARLLMACISYIIELYRLESFTTIMNMSIFKGMLDNKSSVDNGDVINLYMANAIAIFILYLLFNMYGSTNESMLKICNNKSNMNIIIIGIVLNIFVPMLIKPNFIETE
jgi:hypothetical protein